MLTRSSGGAVFHVLEYGLHRDAVGPVARVASRGFLKGIGLRR